MSERIVENVTESATERIDVHFHFDGPITLNVTVAPPPPPPRPVATHAYLTIGGLKMPASFSVDTVGKVGKVVWADDHGDTDALAPGNAIVTYTSDNPAVCAIDPHTGAVTFGTDGTANVGATIADANGAPILEPDNVTPFTVAPDVVTVTAGAAASASMSVG